MQDSTPRRTGSADVLGSPREVSGAEPLDVALTRGRDRLSLIGDWNPVGQVGRLTPAQDEDEPGCA